MEGTDKVNILLESFESTELPSGKRWAEVRVALFQPPWDAVERLLDMGFVLRRFGWGRVEMTLEGYYEEVLSAVREIMAGM